MSKIKLLLDVVDDLRSLADSVQAVANAMLDNEEKPEAPTVEETPKETKPAITKAQVRAVLGTKSQKKGNAVVRDLLKKYGAENLSAVDPKDYPALLADAEVL